MTVIVNDKKLAQKLISSIRKEFKELNTLLTVADSDEADIILNDINSIRDKVNEISLRINSQL